MVFEWSRDFACCQNCGTTRRKHRRRGLCGLCAYASQQIKLAKGWDRSRRETLKGIPRSGTIEIDPNWRRRPRVLLFSDGWDAEQFERFRKAWIAEFRLRLTDLKVREQHRGGRNVDGLTVEYHLRRLVGLIRRKKAGKFYCWATPLTRKFGRKGLVELYRIVDDIIEEIPWKPNWGRIMEETYRLDVSRGSRAKDLRGGQ